MKHILQLTALSAALALAGCGGGSGNFEENTGATNTTSTGTNTGTNTGTTTTVLTAPSSIAVSESKPTLSTGGDSLTLTFRVLDANGGSILGAPITLSIANPTEAGASLSTTSAITTDATTGLATVVVTLASNVMDYRINHNIVLTATSTQAGATASQIITIPATGTTLTLASSTTTIPAAGSASVSATAVDGTGQPMVGATVELLGANGTVIGAPEPTGANGIANFSVPVTAIGSTGQLSVTGELIGTASTALTQASSNTITLSAAVANQTLSFTTASTTSTLINTNAPIQVQVEGATQADLQGVSVNFTTSEGTVTPSSSTISNITQNSSGVWVGTASTTLNSKSPGTATILASYTPPAGTTTSIIGNVQIISTIPSSVTLQAVSTVLAPSANTSIVAVVQDVNGAPVSNATVNFSITNDPSGGILSSPQATTNSSGIATVTYTAGATSTAANAVAIHAVATNGTASASSSVLDLTVAKQSAFITTATDDTIVVNSAYPTYYFQNLADSVVDIAGNPIQNQQVSLVVTPQYFAKGYYTYVQTYTTTTGTGTNATSVTVPAHWQQNITAVCYSPIYTGPIISTNSSSATGASSVLASGYGVGTFQNIPNPVSLLTSSSASAGASAIYTTDTNGSFGYQIRYGKNYATWLWVGLNASTVVGTDQSTSSLSLPLAFLAGDLSSTDSFSPAFQQSPYGTDSNCNDLN